MRDGEQLVRRLFKDGVRRHDEAVLREVLATEQLVQVWLRKFAAFPDLTAEVFDVLVDADRVCTRGVLRGTHRGEFKGIAPTGRSVEIHYIDIWRVAGNRLVENWAEWDVVEALQRAPSAE